VKPRANANSEVQPYARRISVSSAAPTSRQASASVYGTISTAVAGYRHHRQAATSASRWRAGCGDACIAKPKTFHTSTVPAAPSTRLRATAEAVKDRPTAIGTRTSIGNAG
jgi:hypothetical protein